MIWLLIGSPLILLIVVALYLEKRKGMSPPDEPHQKHGAESELARYSYYTPPSSGGSEGNPPQ
ncbi:hypothetical protein [Mesobacillus subterraneus]|uniref:Uncharacterized protein n=1 Tax=Mesobacillus subterraneus TaxID=285983 RepID=A0A427TGZ3_9BACI|nr:hypothetical protein [Mesobacillus subterraneus]RSD22318.1 hypothetical protein EJA10_21450 [Mesobacillus subterraneus]